MRKVFWRGWLGFGLVCGLVMTMLGIAGQLLPSAFVAPMGESVTLSGVWSGVTVERGRLTDEPVPAAASAGGYTATVRLFGLFPIKQVTVTEATPRQVLPGGTPFGIKLYTQGVMVVGMADVDTPTGRYNPAKIAGIRVGDILTHIDQKEVNTNEEVASLVEGSKGKTMVFSLCREGIAFDVRVTPARHGADGGFKTGLWVRDSSAGIGTMTFWDPQTGCYGGLGHGVCDVDTGELLPLSGGEIVPVELYDVVKGEAGNPGELRGGFAAGRLGSLLQNGETGVYGVMDASAAADALLPIAYKQQIRTGAARIYTTVEGDTPRWYDIEIERVRYTASSPGRNMQIRVTDPELLAITGGIVQGMSGSPIVQNGRLIGAVTHVLVDDPTRGYAIFAETMLDTAEKLDRAG